MRTRSRGCAWSAPCRPCCDRVDDIVRASPDLGVVPAQCVELTHLLDTVGADSLASSALTVAELRLLPLLATHLTYREIGERLFVSRNTIKSQAVSLLRKLGARSRNDAVETAEQIGLLGGLISSSGSYACEVMPTGPRPTE